MGNSRKGSSGNVIAAICNFFIPGLGHLVQGRIIGAIFFFVGAAVSYYLLITWPLGVVLHVWSIISAAIYNPGK